MKWIVFALGIALALGGLAAISQGYEIVQVERGWTLVIAGATVFGAGIVTIALGVVVSRIEALIASSVKPGFAEEELAFEADEQESFPLEAAAGERPGVVPARAPLGEAGDETAEAPAATEPAPAMAGRAARGGMGPEVAAWRQPKEPAFSFKPRDFRPWRVRAADEVPAPGPAAAGPSPPPTAAGVAGVRPRATFVPPPMPAKSMPPPGLWPADPAIAAPAPLDPVEARLVESARLHSTRADISQPGEKSEYDWLELALAGTDSAEEAQPKPAVEAQVPEVPQPKPAPEPPPAAATEHDIAGREERDRAVEPSLVHAAEREPVEPLRRESTPDPAHVVASKEEPAGPAILGRYESNGASYLLFEDGTIEAATASGVYRFASMAELKDFIEGKA